MQDMSRVEVLPLAAKVEAATASAIDPATPLPRNRDSIVHKSLGTAHKPRRTSNLVESVEAPVADLLWRRRHDEQRQNRYAATAV